MRFVEGVHKKCIHEGLDLDWCDCTEDIRQECNVQLPTPEEWTAMHGSEVELTPEEIAAHAKEMASQPWWNLFVAEQEGSIRSREDE